MINKIMVSVFCTVYNHEKYLRQCLDGFVMQKTNFAFEVIIHDDASTDHSADIIREYTERYPQIFMPIYQTENQHSQKKPFVKDYMLPLARGKYHAICEGDDYWCDENKLQLQVDAMEAHPNCHLCVHRVGIVTERDEPMGRTYPAFPLETGVLSSEEFLKMVLKTYSFQTSSYLRRMDDMREFITNPPEFRRVADVGDVPGLLYCGMLGDVYYLDREMSHYRWQSVGSWNQRHRENKELQHHHLICMIHMYEEFNKFTHYGYNEHIVPAVNSLQIYQLRYTSGEIVYARALCRKENRYLLKDKSVKYRIYILLRAYAPFLADFYYWIKGKRKP